LSDKLVIAVDAMGGDFGPRVTIPASLQALKQHAKLNVILIGDTAQIEPLLASQPVNLTERISLVHCDKTIAMDEKPSRAIRHGRQSSMAVALSKVADGSAQACVSAGNTGALMALGRLVLRTLPGIDRPAIITAIPTVKNHCYALDLGANVDCSAEQLLQFAVMGSVMVQSIGKSDYPTVGLLNVGSEDVKGNEQVRLATSLIADHGQLNYIGFIEGDDLFSGKADVVVCDGFVGNIALKSSEGLARMISDKVQRSFRQSWYRKILALLAAPVLKDLAVQLDPSRRNGASLLGLNGVVIKSHGGADQDCFAYAIEQAVIEAHWNVPKRISESLAAQLH